MAAAAANFPVVITAVDKTKEAMERVEKRFEHLTKPLDRVSSATKAVVGENGVSRAIESLLKVGKSGAVAQAGLFGAATELESFADIAGFAGVAATGFAGAAAIAVGAAAEFGMKSAEGTAHQKRLADAIGLSINDLNVLSNAFEANGVQRDAAQTDFKTLADTIHSAKWSGNNQVLAAMGAMGVKARFLANGNVDVKNTLVDLAGVLSKYDAQSQQKYAAMFGVTDLLPLLRRGSKATADAIADADRRTLKLSDHQVEASDTIEGANKRAAQSWTALKGVLAQKLIIPWLKPFMDETARQNEDLIRALTGQGHYRWRKSGFGFEIADNNPAPAGAAVPKMTSKDRQAASAKALGFFTGQGLTRAQAAGFVGGLLGESGLNPHAVGDHGLAYGIGQWHPDRQANFEKLFGHSIRKSTLDEQLRFAWWELTHTERTAGRRLGQASTVAEAAGVNARYYERSANIDRDTAVRTALGERVLKVEVDFTNAPKGTVAQTSGSKNVQASTRIAHAMPEAG